MRSTPTPHAHNAARYARTRWGAGSSGEVQVCGVCRVGGGVRCGGERSSVNAEPERER